MTKQDIERDIKKEIGSWPTQAQIAKYLRKSRDYVRNMLCNAEYLPDGKAKKYFAGDIAEEIYKRRSVH